MKKLIHVPIVKKIHWLERAQYAFLDHSKTLVLCGIIKIEILNICALVQFVSIPRFPKKLYRATLKEISNTEKNCITSCEKLK